MKAVRMYAPGDLRVEEVPMPEVRADEALIKVMAVGVCGSDIPRANVYGAHVSPITLGHEFSGVIEQVGAEVRGFAVGDRVTVPPLIPCGQCHWCQVGEYSLCEDYDYYGSRRDGAMAEYVSVKQGNLLKVPAGIPFETAAATDPSANALHAMRRAQYQPGESVCVFGVGPIGLFAVQYAKFNQAKTIIAVDIWPEKLALAKELGANVILDSRSEDIPARVKAATGGIGADVVIDCTGVPAIQQETLHCASKMGRVILLGISHKGLNLGENEVDEIMRSQLEVRGSWNSFGKPFPGVDWTGSLQLMEQGMSAREIISHRLPLEEAPGIFKKIAEGGFYFNKIMFYPHGVVAD